MLWCLYPLISQTHITDIRFTVPPDLEFIELVDKSKFLEGKGVEKKDTREFSWSLAYDCATNAVAQIILFVNFFVTETALSASIKEMKVTKATLNLAKDYAKDAKDMFVEQKFYQNCVTVLFPLISNLFTAALVIIGAAVCLLAYLVVWLILELTAYLAKIGYHIISILIEGLSIAKTDFAKGKCG